MLRRRRLAVAFLVLLALLAVPLASLGYALTRPTGESLAAKTAEWARGHALGFLVNQAERLQYALAPPPVGGEPVGGVPSVGDTRVGSGLGAGADGVRAHGAGKAKSARPTASPAGVPAAVAPLPGVAPLSGEGQWQPVVDTAGGIALREAFVRADPQHTSVLIGLAAFDPALVRFTLHPGTQVPAPGHWQQPPDVPAGDRSGLVATFNSAFRLGDARGGFLTEGRTVAPLRSGAASLVLTKDGRATVGMWGRDVGPGPDVATVRQNLDLVVDGGQVVPGLDSDPTHRWGATLGNKLYVWRSGVGVTADGNLIYAAGPALSVQTLAQTLQRAGAVRAMELDINPEWTTFVSYAPAPGTPSGVTPTKLLASMQRPATRYLSPDTRDFVAATLR